MKPGYRSLRRKVFGLILAVSVLLLLAVGGINIIMNIVSTLVSYKRETAHELQYAVSLIDEDYLEKIFSEVRRIYDSTPEDIRSDPFSKEYKEQLMELIDDDFWDARDIIVKCREQAELDSVSLLIPDEDKERIIFVIDGYDLSGAYLPGQWLSDDITDIDSPKEIRLIIESDTKMYFDYGEENGWVATNYIEIHDRDGNFLGYAASDINITGFINRMFRGVTIYFLLLAVTVLLMASFLSRNFQSKMIAPINTLARAAQDYTKRDKTVEEGPAEEYFDGLMLNTGDEIETLWSSLSEMEKDINETMHRIREMAAEKERVEAELSVATRIQEGVLPKKFPAFPGRDEFDIYAYMKPAREVGGDLYDFFLIDNDHLCMVVGDVSGKGVPAALFMVVAASVIKNVARVEKDLPAIMKEVNNQMCENNREAFFVTIWLGIYTISERKLRYANAGHEDPVFYHAKEGRYSLYTTEHDIPMGIMEDMEYQEEVFMLEPGDKIFIYSDGVPEATRADDVLYGPGRMTECLNSAKDLGGEGTITAVREDVEKFIEGADQFDDMTMLYFEVR